MNNWMKPLPNSESKAPLSSSRQFDHERLDVYQLEDEHVEKGG